jgi:nicotinamide-nucleotide amidase
MNAEVISIGDELLIGQVINTNQAFIAEKLNSIGIAVGKMTTVGDEERAILQSFDEALKNHDLVLVTGGLGPTHDDITRTALCKFFKSDLVVNEETLRRVRSFFEKRGLAPKKINEDQALVPRSCTPILNDHGTAPGFLFEHNGRTLIAMPGVPFEMKAMVENNVLPLFAAKASGLVIRHRTLKTTGIGESFLAEQIGDIGTLFSPEDGVTLAFLPGPTGTRLRITVRAKSTAEADQSIDRVEQRIRNKAGKYIYAAGEEELEQVIGTLLLERHLTLAVAESCTGGLIADRITNVPGSSKYFERSFVNYSNDSKIADLGIPSSLILRHGAVSSEVATAMAGCVRAKSNTDIGLSTTGIAGPDGGSDEKPVGLVWVGYADHSGAMALKFNFGDNRRRTKERAAQAALELLRRKLLNIDV